MFEETLEAASRAISFLGEAALRTSAANLVTRARKVAVEAEGTANADHQGESKASTEAISVLLEAATALEENVDSAGRKLAVSGLLGAATTLEAVLGVGLDNLGGEAAYLARQCGDYQEAADAIEEVRCRAVAEQQRQQNGSAPRWLFWRRRQPRVFDFEDGGMQQRLLDLDLQTPATMDAARTAVDFLTNEAVRTGHLVELADNIVLYAHSLTVSNQTIREARDALQQADSQSSMKNAVNGLEAAATGLKETCSARQIMLRDPARELVAACQEYLGASDAMDAVQRAATERARAHQSAIVPIQNAPPPPSPDPGQGDQTRSGWLGCALGGSLCLAPYLVATNGNPAAKLVLEYNDRWNINLALSLWWSVVAAGAVCSSYARSWIEVCYAQLAARFGVYGMNVFVIYFLYWMLGIDDKDTRRYCLWFASALHFLFLLVACCRRDP